MEEKKRKGRKGERFSGYANREKSPSYAIAKKYVLLTKSFSP